MIEMTPEQRAELDELKLALQQEYEASSVTVDPNESKKDLEDLRPNMLLSLSRVLKHGTLEQQSKVAMWGYGKLMEEGKAKADPLADLLKDMPAPKPVGEPDEATVANAQDIPLDVLTEPDVA